MQHVFKMGSFSFVKGTQSYGLKWSMEERKRWKGVIEGKQELCREKTVRVWEGNAMGWEREKTQWDKLGKSKKAENWKVCDLKTH